MAEIPADGLLAFNRERIVSLGIFAIVNWAVAIILVREWARRMGYRPEREAVRQPILTQGVGGLQAARRLGASELGTQA